MITVLLGSTVSRLSILKYEFSSSVLGESALYTMISEVTIKSSALVAALLLPATDTEILPVVAPDGTITVKVVAVLDITTAGTPLNVTMLLEGVVLKFVPVIITVVPIGPEVEVKLIMVGGMRVLTVKFEALNKTEHPIIISSGPEVAPGGIVTVNVVGVEAVIVAGKPLILTRLLKGVMKSVPVMVTEVPTGPDVGANEVIVGGEIEPTTFRNMERELLF